MTTRLIYLLENDFQQNLANVLNKEDFSDQNVVFFVELRKMDDQLVPMIADLSKMRLIKAKKRIESWIREKVKGIDHFEVFTFDGHPSRTNPSYRLDLSGTEKVNVSLAPQNENRFIPYLKHNAGSHQIFYLSLGDFNDQDING